MAHDGGAGPAFDRTAEQPVQVVIGDYALLLANSRPSLYERYVQHALMVDELGLDAIGGTLAFTAVVHAAGPWPFLLVLQRYTTSAGTAGRGAVLLPETRRLFLAATDRLLAYDLAPDRPRRLWEDSADLGFHGWRLHGEVVLMAAELELAAWDSSAHKLWSTFVEPPWDYRVEDDMVVLDVMGRVSRFPLRSGPPPPSARHRLVP